MWVMRVDPNMTQSETSLRPALSSPKVQIASRSTSFQPVSRAHLKEPEHIA